MNTGVKWERSHLHKEERIVERFGIHRSARPPGVLPQQADLLDLCFRLLDHAKVMPYYFYMCDMIPNSEHWRVPLASAQHLQHAIMGYLPGFATPRVVCDVPFVGKRYVNQADSYDRELGISYWSKNYTTRLDRDDEDALKKRYPYYDPIDTLQEEGREHWREVGAVTPA